MAFTAIGALGACPACGEILGIEPGSVVAKDGGLGEAAVPPVDASSDGGADEARAPSSGDDFTVSLGSQTRVTVVRDGEADVTVSIARAGSHPSAVTVTAAGLPAGVTADPLSIPATATSGTLTLHASASATLTVTATLEITASAAPFTHQVTVPLFVQDPPGTLDVTFGTGGVTTVPLVGARASAGLGNHGLVLQPGGEIVFCGNALFGGNYELVLGRLTAAGSVDSTFGSGGLVVMNEPGHGVDVCGGVQVLPSGSIVFGGFTVVPNDPNYPHAFLAGKFTPRGKLDTSFGGSGSGFFFTDIGNVDSKVYDVAVQPDGKVILGGFSGGNFALMRLWPDGTTDTTFGPNGDGILLSARPGEGFVSTLAVFPNGDLLTALLGTSFFATRVTSGGLFDSSYGTGGHATAPAATPQFAGSWGIALQPDGTAVLSGYTTPSGNTAGAIQLTRFNADGKLDTTFGHDGLVSTTIPGGNAIARGVVRTRDGGFAVAAGLPTSTPIGIVRYDATGALDTRFAGVGYTGLPGTSSGSVVAVDDAGRIVLGAFTTSSAADTAAVVVARFWP